MLDIPGRDIGRDGNVSFRLWFYRNGDPYLVVLPDVPDRAADGLEEDASDL